MFNIKKKKIRQKKKDHFKTHWSVIVTTFFKKKGNQNQNDTNRVYGVVVPI